MTTVVWAALCAGQLTIEGPRAAPEHRAVRLAASAAPSPEAIVLWDVQPLGRDPGAAADDLDIVKEEPAALWFVAPPGRYAVRLVVKEPKAPQRSARLTVVVTPRAAPTPAPTPPPTPPPQEAKVVATIVDDAANRTPELGALFVSPTWRKALTDGGHRWYWLDGKDELLAKKRLDRAVREAGGVPALVLQAPDGRVLAALKCPNDEAGLLAAVQAAAKSKETRP